MLIFIIFSCNIDSNPIENSESTINQILLNNKLTEGKYDEIIKLDQFTDILEKDLWEVANDLHIRIHIQPFLNDDERVKQLLPDIALAHWGRGKSSLCRQYMICILKIIYLNI